MQYITIIVLLLIACLVDWGFLTNEITSYPMWCVKDASYKSGKLCYTNRHKRYRIDKKDNLVVHWVDGFKGSAWRDTNCVIVDRKNWNCKNKDNESFGFEDGGYFVYSPSEIVMEHEKEITYIPKFYVIYLYWKNYLGWDKLN